MSPEQWISQARVDIPAQLPLLPRVKLALPPVLGAGGQEGLLLGTDPSHAALGEARHQAVPSQSIAPRSPAADCGHHMEADGPPATGHMHGQPQALLLQAGHTQGPYKDTLPLLDQTRAQTALALISH